MAPRLFVCTFFLIQVLISSAQSSLQQYLHITGLAQNAQSAGHNLPNVGYSRQTMPNGLSTMPNGALANLANLAGLTSLTSGLQTMPSAGMTAMPNSGMTPMSNSGMTAMPNSGMAPMSNSGMTVMPNSGMTNVPNAGLSALSALASIPGLLQALTSTTASCQAQPATPSTGVPTLTTQSFQPSCSAPSVPTSKQNPPSTAATGGLDSGVLNNLAIALQLLIVSNILNSNLPENEANPIYELLETAKMIPVSFSQTESQSQKSSTPSQSSSNISSDLQTYEELIKQYSVPSRPPNANFVGSSGFTDFSVSDPYIKPSSRNSFQLMSPYEALGPNSPFSDPIISSAYGSVMSSKRDFQSPYIMMDSDPFANDLFL